MSEVPQTHPAHSPAALAERKRAMPLVLPTIFPGAVDWNSANNPENNEKSYKTELEIGFGRPHFLLELAAEKPDSLVIGIEWKRRWSLQAHDKSKTLGLTNVCALHGNAWLMAGPLFKKESIDNVYINFPDPWWKSKHRKRRVVNDAFTNLIAERLKKGGHLLIQTDVASLLEEILEHFEAHPSLRNVAGSGRLSKKILTKARTHREKRCVLEGIPIFRGLLIKE